MAPNPLIALLLWFPAFLFSTTVHEAAHALVAMWGGDRTAYQGGQVTLSPLPHIRREPIGMLVVPLVTSLTQGWAMGWASSPYDPWWAERYPRRAAWMAAAGPAGNFLIAFAAFALLKAGLALGWFSAPSSVVFDRLVVPAGTGSGLVGFAATALSILLMLNVILGAFNLVPLPPLDGATVAELFLPENAARSLRTLARTPAFSIVGLIVAWNVFPHVVRPLFGFVVDLLHPGLYAH
ncbi:MAG TPA: site-2 protease family protein [Terriglobales bacterium]|nr:site-2 protease family protein [Terriglobales bacterium]